MVDGGGPLEAIELCEAEEEVTNEVLELSIRVIQFPDITHLRDIEGLKGPGGVTWVGLKVLAVD